MKKAIYRKKDANKAECTNITMENNNRHRSTKSKTKTTTSKAVREKAEEELNEFKNSQRGMCSLGA